jgi:membrane protease YdiL (CAAX protease family)
MTLPALVFIGLTISLVSRFLSEIPSGPHYLPPQGVFPWTILAISCISTAYLEESFFRFYLLSKREEMGIGPHRAVLISTLLFSVCHIYEGPWGFLNAALSGVVLAFVFLRFRSLHGIALAHALYNVLVYAISS